MVRKKVTELRGGLLSELLANGEKDAGPMKDNEAQGGGDGRRRVGAGSAERSRPATAPRGEENAREARKEGSEGQAQKERAGQGRNKGPASDGANSQPVYVRLSRAMLSAVEKAVENSPIEFADRSEFIKRAIEHELRRRGLLETYK